MKLYFDYIFFRMAQFFFKRDGSAAIRAILGISMIQMLIAFIILFAITHFTVNAKYIHLYSKQFASIGILITLIFIIYNHRKYKGRYSDFREYWKDELHSQRVVKGYLVIASLILPWIIAFLTAIYLK